MIGEVDPRAGVADFEDRREYLVERLGRHHVGDERSDAATRGRGGFLVGVAGNTRLRDVPSMTEMKMSVDHAGKYHKAASRELFLAEQATPGSEDRRETAVL